MRATNSDRGLFAIRHFPFAITQREFVVASLFTVALLIAGATPAEAQFTALCNRTTPPRVEAKGTDLLIDGKPRFSVMVSYFDPMHAPMAAIESDFAFLKSKGVSGLRIFPLWVREAGQPTAQKPDVTLLDSDGRVRSQERWDHFAGVLKRAGQCGFLVDVTFNRENLNNISTFTLAEYRGDPKTTSCTGNPALGRGIAEVACRLRGDQYSHVIFDLQNERNVGGKAMDLTIAELRSLHETVKAVAPSRMTMVSHGGGDMGSPVEAMREVKLDITAYHEGQSRGWYQHTAAQVAKLKELGKPVYMQESARATDGGERGARCAPDPNAPNAPNPFILAMTEARRAGAAAWTFHTDAGFRLDGQQFQKEIAGCAIEADFLNRLGSALSAGVGR